MPDSDVAGRESERTCTVPVYEDHLAFLRDLDREGGEEPVIGQRLLFRLQLAAAAAVGVAAIAVIATLAAVAAAGRLWRLGRDAFRHQNRVNVEIRRV